MRSRGFAGVITKILLSYAKVETPATQGVEESVQYESIAHGKCQTRDTNLGVISVFLRSEDDFSHNCK